MNNSAGQGVTRRSPVHTPSHAEAEDAKAGPSSPKADEKRVRTGDAQDSVEHSKTLATSSKRKPAQAAPASPDEVASAVDAEARANPLAGRFITNTDAGYGEDALLRGTLASAYAFSGQPVKWGTGYVTPMSLYFPRTPNEVPPTTEEFKAWLPVHPQPDSEMTELTYRPKVALTPNRHEIDSPLYWFAPPPKGYPSPKLYSTWFDNTEQKYPNHRWIDGPVGQVVRNDDVMAQLPPSAYPWFNLREGHGFHDILRLPAAGLMAMPPKARDRLLDALEDHGKFAMTRYFDKTEKDKPRWCAAELGPAATLALNMKANGDPKAFGAIVGARPVPLISELLTILPHPFTREEIPWIAYYALPRLQMEQPFEQGFAATAIASAICSVLEMEFGKAGIRSKAGGADALLEQFRTEGLKQVLPGLEAEKPLLRYFHAGTLYGLFLAGAMMYVKKVQEADENAREWVEWSIKSSLVIILTGTGVLAPAVITVLDKTLDGISKSAAKMAIKERDWMDALSVAITAFERSHAVKSIADGVDREWDKFEQGLATTVRLFKDARSMYDDDFSKHATLKKQVAQHPRLARLAAWLFPRKQVKVDSMQSIMTAETF